MVRVCASIGEPYAAVLVEARTEVVWRAVVVCMWQSCCKVLACGLGRSVGGLVTAKCCCACGAYAKIGEPVAVKLVEAR